MTNDDAAEERFSKLVEGVKSQNKEYLLVVKTFDGHFMWQTSETTWAMGAATRVGVLLSSVFNDDMQNTR